MEGKDSSVSTPDSRRSERSIHRRSSDAIEYSNPQEALQDLLDGNARFMAGESDHPHATFQRLQVCQGLSYKHAFVALESIKGMEEEDGVK